MNGEISIASGHGVKLVILIEVKPGEAQQQIDLYEKIRPLVLEEDGCLQYELSRVAGCDNKFVLIECWESQRHLALHEKTPHMIEADAISPSFRASPATVLHLDSLNITT